MSKLIIWVPGKPLLYGYHRSEFKWSEPHQCYIYQGRVFEEKEFNGAADRALKNYADLFPSVKVVEFSEPVVAERHEITVAEAEEVLIRYAPHRLKQKSGPKPAHAAA